MTDWIDRLLSCAKEPPQEFKDEAVRMAAEFWSVSEPHWVVDPSDGQWLLTAKRMAPPTTQAGEASRNLLEGFYKGYTMALGRTKPYYVDAPKVRVETWGDKAFGEIRVPILGKVVRHWFASYEEAEAFAESESKKYSELTDKLWPDRDIFDKPAGFKWSLDLKARYDEDRAVHF